MGTLRKPTFSEYRITSSDLEDKKTRDRLLLEQERFEADYVPAGSGLWLLAYLGVIMFVLVQTLLGLGRELGFLLSMGVAIGILYPVCIYVLQPLHSGWFESKKAAERERRFGRIPPANSMVNDYLVAIANYEQATHLEQTKARHYWERLSGIEFESEFAALLNRLGYSVELTPPRADGGIDIRARKGDRKIIIQCKAWNKPCPPAPVRELNGVRESREEAWVVCTGGFSEKACEFGRDKKIKLIGIEDIVSMAARVT